MSLNIKNETVCALARRAADLTGASQTSVVEEALRRLLADLEHDTREAEITRAVAALQASVLPEFANMTSKQLMDDLYDEDGIPR